MFRQVLPRCTVTGPVDPVPYSHLINGAIPRKCGACKNLFEGGCRRAFEQVEHYLALDHGACPVKGPTNPVQVETEFFVSKVQVPEKCSTCRHLKLDPPWGFVCNFEHERWGDFPRTLDWGAWSPEHPNLGLKSGRSITPEMLNAVAIRQEALAIKVFRATHTDATFHEAREAYAELLAKLEAYRR